VTVAEVKKQVDERHRRRPRPAAAGGRARS
jgi:hypothetical protein